ncbi:aldehyde dehydrogenase [Stappia sp. P2PMeth1]|uniref:aldehyde dehydrogenase family protein n=1 Tax=Stappia sp. P2PMeth1 TaxID=2003586 RepID=UPI001644FA05|nr:aldehyde dehydrogenase family protein [Stappia sp. P2PMeth1]
MTAAARAEGLLAKIPCGKLFIGGQWREAGDRTQIPVIDPASERVIAHIPAATAQDVDEAVEAAHAVFTDRRWRRMRPLDRGRLLERLAMLIEREADELAALETLDNGKPLWISRNIDMRFAVDALRYYAGWASKITGEVITPSPLVDDGGIYRTYTERVPVGVVAGITPWNFPLGQAIQKLAPAIAFGCTVVLKPSEMTSLTSLRLAQLIEEAEFPAGSVSIVTGFGHEAGAALVRHPRVRKIAFTGSTATGQAILLEATRSLKRVTLELGGKSPTIVLADADLEGAIEGAANAIFANSGQVCTAGSRLLIAAPVFEEVVKGVAERAGRLRLGSGFDASTDLGPLVSAAQREKVSAIVSAAIDGGAEVRAGGHCPAGAGYFFRPTVLTRPDPACAAATEEIFGPVVVAMPFSDRGEAVALANATPFGLGASIWTRDLDAAHLLAEDIEAGTVWLNTHNVLDVAVPFGGMKMSGLGREFGSEVVHAYTEVKSVSMRLRP